MINQLSGAPKQTAPAKSDAHPFFFHAQMHQRINAMQPHERDAMSSLMDYAVPILGKLASDPKVSRKDVIKAAADAAGNGAVQPSKAVEMISSMPDDPAQLRPWLQGLYEAHLTAMVHTKAAQMQQAQPAPGVPQHPQAAAQGVPQ